MADECRATSILARKYGLEPFGVVVVHGGPGAAGDMGPVAQKLAISRGVLEPLQTASTVEGQVEELRAALESLSVPPAVLIGHSWGAWLSCIVAATYPRLVRKLILIGTPPFEEAYVQLLRENRLKLAPNGDSYDPIAIDVDLSIPSISERAGEIYAGVWPEAASMRRSGELLRLLTRIKCPVVAIHGDHDPHPIEGMSAPLTATVRDFQMVVLDKCGHAPWRERWAVDRFYAFLTGEC